MKNYIKHIGIIRYKWKYKLSNSKVKLYNKNGILLFSNKKNTIEIIKIIEYKWTIKL